MFKPACRQRPRPSREASSRQRTGPHGAPAAFAVWVAFAAFAAFAVFAVFAVFAPPAIAKPKVELGAHGQVRHVLDVPADDPATGEDESARPLGNAVLLRRLRLDARAKRGQWRGRVLFAVDRGKPRLLTGALSYRFAADHTLSLGQRKRMLSVAYVDSSRHQRLPERVALADGFDGERDIGVVWRSRLAGRRVDLHLAAWNGAGPNVVGNETGRPMLEARVDATLVGRIDTESARIASRFGLRVGAAAVVGQRSAVRSGSSGQLTAKDDHLGASGTIALCFARVEARVEALWLRDAPIDARADTSTPLPVATVDQLGIWAQLAVQPSARWELALRWAKHDKDRDDPDRDEHRLSVGVGFRPGGDDDVKIQLAVEQQRDLRKGGAVYVRNGAQTQLQVAF